MMLRTRQNGAVIMMEAAKRNVTPLAFGAKILFWAALFPIVILGFAGDWKWREGWIFGVWFSIMTLSTLTYMYFKDPELLAERSRPLGTDNQKTWDVYLGRVMYVVSMAWFLLMPLDARRFHWSPVFPSWLHTFGGVLLVPAFFFIYRAVTDNTFLSARVRAQHDRRQRVISTGVYGFVRHPLYLGVTLMLVGGPLLLGSLVGAFISAFALAIFVGRIIGEEKMMLEELEGYAAYKKKVRYRLVPGIW